MILFEKTVSFLSVLFRSSCQLVDPTTLSRNGATLLSADTLLIFVLKEISSIENIFLWANWFYFFNKQMDWFKFFIPVFLSSGKIFPLADEIDNCLHELNKKLMNCNSHIYHCFRCYKTLHKAIDHNRFGHFTLAINCYIILFTCYLL